MINRLQTKELRFWENTDVWQPNEGICVSHWWILPKATGVLGGNIQGLSTIGKSKWDR